MADEKTLWQGSPSQAENATLFIPLAVCAAILLYKAPAWLALIPIAPAMWYWLVTRCTRYKLTSDRLRVEAGVLNSTLDDLELYRVRDYRIDRTLLHRLMGLGSIVLITADKTDPVLVLRAIRHAAAVSDQLRAAVEDCRQRKNVREIDV